MDKRRFMRYRTFGRTQRAVQSGSKSTATRRVHRAGLYRRSEEHTSELQSRSDLVCRLLLEKKKSKPQDCQSKRTTSVPEYAYQPLSRASATRLSRTTTIFIHAGTHYYLIRGVCAKAYVW